MSTSPKPFRSGVWISAPQIKTLSIENFWLHHCWPWLGRPDGSMTTWPDVSTVQSLVLTQQPLYPSSLRPPAASNESIHKRLSASHVAHSAIWKHWRPAMHLLIPGRPGILGMTFAHSRFPEWKNRPGNGFPTCICPADATATHCLLLQ